MAVLAVTETVFTALIGGVALVAAAAIGALGMWWRERIEIRLLRQDLATQRQERQDLKTRYEDLARASAGGIGSQSRRLISYQVLVLEHEIRKTANLSQKPTIDILGINALGPLHQGREILRDALVKGARLRVLLLDPASQAFEERREKKEKDTVGRLLAEWNAALYMLADIVQQVAKRGVTADIEIRAHRVMPKLSLIMIDVHRENGLILENPYESLREERGLMGAAYVWSPGSGHYEWDRDCFANYWSQGRSLSVADLPSPVAVA